MVEHVEGGDEELVSVLLLVAGQVAGVGPYQVKKLEGNVRSDLTGIELSVVVYAWACVQCHEYGRNGESGIGNWESE
jgi:hypothetical protein